MLDLVMCFTGENLLRAKDSMIKGLNHLAAAVGEREREGMSHLFGGLGGSLWGDGKCLDSLELGRSPAP